MASKKPDIDVINELSNVVQRLSLKIETLQAKVNELCKKTDCKRVKNVNKDLLPERTDTIAASLLQDKK
tara:strand:+ start:779 stop:985 length:207 start_codon:yes stop_codon:yes gene_type:complete